MSTKIWTAWRIPKSRLHEATEFIDNYFMNKFRNARDRITEEYTKKTNDTKQAISWKIYDFYCELNKNMNHDCGFNFWIRHNYIYIIPYGLNGWIPTEDEVPDWFEDYHYQNQTDRPDHITAQTYNNRRKMWDKLIGDSTVEWYAHRYQHISFAIPDLYEFQEDDGR
jgi:hypothetical protein